MLKVSGNFAGSLTYQSTWDANANSPFLQSSVGTKGFYYVVSVAGNTNLNGITNWNVGDWAVFDGSVWEKVDNNNAVTSVNGQTGSVVLTAANVGAVSNTVNVIAGAGLTGGGQLTSNVTININTSPVTAGTYGSSQNVAQITVNALGIITSVSNVSIPQGTVTNVQTGTGLTGGPITSTGTISLANTTVTAGTYTYVTLTVDAQGRLTAASSNTSPVTAVTATAPIQSSGGATPNISITQAGATSNGYLSSTDWNTFNNKQPSGTYVTSVSGTAGQIVSSGGTTPAISLNATSVSAGTYGSAPNVAQITVDTYGRITSASNVAIAIPVSQVSGAVPNTITITTGTGLTGGGNLSQSRTISVVPNSTNQNVTVDNNGVLVGSQPAINLIPSGFVTITTVNDTTNSAVAVTLGTSGLGTMATQNANAVVITGGTINNVTMSNSTITGGTIQNVALTFDSIQNTPIGNVTPNVGVFTTLNASTSTITNLASGNVTITGGTANFTTLNVAYSGASSNIASFSVGGFANITADTGIIATFVGNSSTYAYTAVQNKQTSATAYGSYSLYNDLGTAYGDLGFNSSTYNYASAGFPNNAFSGPNNMFLQSGSTDLAIGTFLSNAIHLIANGNVSITDAITVTSNNRISQQLEIATKNAAYTITTSDLTILANAAPAPFTVTLPSASTSGSGRHYVVKKIDATANTVTISTTSSQTIDGASTYAISTQYSGVQVQSDGSNWWIIANLNGRNGTAGTF